MATKWLSALLLLLFVALPAAAKAPTAKVTVTGPGIDKPIELTQREAIAANVWSGNFIDEKAGQARAPAAELPRYTVQFHVQLDDEVRMMYVVYYVWDSAAGRALLQVPDVSDKWYQLNVSTISRCCHGKWFYASRPWGETIGAALPAKT
ncbi:MAG TPA: hypothetical protein VH814_09705 [Steroidobacteraceae bacterium]